MPVGEEFCKIRFFNVNLGLRETRCFAGRPGQFYFGVVSFPSELQQHGLSDVRLEIQPLRSHPVSERIHASGVITVRFDVGGLAHHIPVVGNRRYNFGQLSFIEVVWSTWKCSVRLRSCKTWFLAGITIVCTSRLSRLLVQRGETGVLDVCIRQLFLGILLVSKILCTTRLRFGSLRRRNIERGNSEHQQPPVRHQLVHQVQRRGQRLHTNVGWWLHGSGHGIRRYCQRAPRRLGYCNRGDQFGPALEDGDQTSPKDAARHAATGRECHRAEKER
mmetsp:Transcript_51497/g.120756  ORF Transcript_51497/g.120756 Transcript_51497/m.120756 type:complete len:275 (-) Transcript_51497:571-1395(-)